MGRRIYSLPFVHSFVGPVRHKPSGRPLPHTYMRTLIILVFSIITSIIGVAQTQVPVAHNSKVLFKIKNFGLNVNGSFSGLAGKILFDPANPTGGSMDVSIDANTVNTGNNMRDNHLRKDEYFDVKTYPRIHFVSTRIEGTTRPGSFIARGRLTIRNTTKDVVIPFTASPVTSGFVLKGEFKINRRDFGVGGNNTISDNLLVCLEVTTRRE
jgi:polyisoprenoid-binding protein YceI